MTTEPEAIPAETVEAIQEAAIEFGLMLTDEHATALAKAIADRASRAPVDGAGWRPIETAPRDGSRFLALEGDRHFDCWMTCDPRDGCYWMDEADSEPAPTHWMPLPTAPGTHPAPASPDAEMVEEAAILERLADRYAEVGQSGADGMANLLRDEARHLRKKYRVQRTVHEALSKHEGDQS